MPTVGPAGAPSSSCTVPMPLDSRKCFFLAVVVPPGRAAREGPGSCRDSEQAQCKALGALSQSQKQGML